MALVELFKVGGTRFVLFLLFCYHDSVFTSTVPARLGYQARARRASQPLILSAAQQDFFTLQHSRNPSLSELQRYKASFFYFNSATAPLFNHILSRSVKLSHRVVSDQSASSNPPVLLHVLHTQSFSFSFFIAAMASIASVPDFGYLATTINRGPAMFSTDFGFHAPRTAVEPMPPNIVRYHPMVDVPAFKSNLRKNFPNHCKLVIAPVDNLYQYFDHWDLHMHGTDFIYAVLVELALENSTRAQAVLSFATYWKAQNSEIFHSPIPFTLDLFREETIYNCGVDFLNDVLTELAKLREVLTPPGTPPIGTQAGKLNPRIP